MAYLNERVSYLKGLAEGLGISEETAEGKLLKAMLDVMQEISDEVEVVTAAQDELAEDVAELMESCAECMYDDEDDYFEIECEKCGEIVIITDDMLDSEDGIICPTCGEPIEIEFCCDCEDGDCEACGE
ncbi:MAG: hypothetical protein IJC89_04010 [Clostridia bacterium]|nr:hypothetical protein [Clostridia bacterium]